MKIAPLKVSLFIVITVSILMMISGLLFYKNLVGLLGAWSQGSKMNIFLKVDTTAPEINEIITAIKENDSVATVALIDRAQAGRAFQNSLKEFSTGLITDDEMIDLIPETIEVDLKNSVSLLERESIFSHLAASLKNRAQIDEISYSASWLKKFEMVDGIFRSTGLLVFLVLLFTISYLVALMLRVYIDDSKQEIEIYSLLGATRWSIYKLFLKDVFLFLTASLVVSFLLLFVAFNIIKSKLQSSGLSAIVSDNLRFLSFEESMVVVAALFIFIYVNSLFTIQTSVNKLNQLSND